MDLHIKDIVELKKTHPCGSKQWELTRVGMDIKPRHLSLISIPTLAARSNGS